MNTPPFSDSSVSPATTHMAADMTSGTWWRLLLALLICAPPLFIANGARDVTTSMESISLVSAQETWLRWHEGESYAWLITTNDDRIRPEKPPMLAWVCFASWIGLDHASPDPLAMAQRARTATALLALMMLAAMFFIARALASNHVALLGTVIAGTMLLFQKQARIASYDMHMTAWATMAVAFGLVAIRSVSQDRVKMVTLWMLCAATTAAAVLSKNPLGFVLTAIPCGSAIVIFKTNRRAAILGLAGAMLLAAVLSIPWYVWVAIEFSEIRAALTEELVQGRGDDAQPWYYYVGLIALVAPWSLWFISGLIHPFTKNVRGDRRAVVLAAVWFVAIMLVFSIHPAKQQRYILPIIPAAAFLIAQVFLDHNRRSSEGRGDRSVRVLASIHWLALLAVSILVVPLLASQEWIIDQLTGARTWWLDRHATGTIAAFMQGDDWPAAPFLASMGWMWAITTGITLVAVALIGYHVHWRWRSMQTCVYTAVWSSILFSAVWCVYANAPDGRLEARDQAAEFLARVENADLYSLRITEADHTGYKLPHQFRYYVGRRIGRITPEQLAAMDDTAAVIIIARRRDIDRDVLESLGYERRFTQITDSRGHAVDVWRRAQ